MKTITYGEVDPRDLRNQDALDTAHCLPAVDAYVFEANVKITGEAVFDPIRCDLSIFTEAGEVRIEVPDGDVGGALTRWIGGREA